MTPKRRAGSVPWLAVSGSSHPAPMPNNKRPPETRSALATSLAVVIGSRCGPGERPRPAPRPAPWAGRAARRDRHERVQRALVARRDFAAAGERRVIERDVRVLGE